MPRVKTERIVVCVTPVEKDDIEKWAECEGRSASSFMHQLFKDYKRAALAEGRGPVGDEK